MGKTLNIGECTPGFSSKRVTSTFYRLEKVYRNYACNRVDIYDFHTVNNGNFYIYHSEYDLNEDGSRSFARSDKSYRLGQGEQAKDRGNKKYKELLDEGYEFAGVYESDFQGYKRRIK